MSGEAELSLAALVEAGLNESRLFEAEEREEMAQAVAESVKERTLHLLTDEESTQDLGEQLQEAVLRDEDVLAAAISAGIAGEEAFAESFSVALAAVLDELVEVSEDHDAQDLRRRLHEGVSQALHDAIHNRQVEP